MGWMTWDFVATLLHGIIKGQVLQILGSGWTELWLMWIGRGNFKIVLLLIWCHMPQIIYHFSCKLDMIEEVGVMVHVDLNLKNHGYCGMIVKEQLKKNGIQEGRQNRL